MEAPRPALESVLADALGLPAQAAAYDDPALAPAFPITDMPSPMSSPMAQEF